MSREEKEKQRRFSISPLGTLQAMTVQPTVMVQQPATTKPAFGGVVLGSDSTKIQTTTLTRSPLD